MSSRIKLTLILFLILLLVQPGSNAIQQLNLHRGTPVIRETSLVIPTSAVVPVSKNRLNIPRLSAYAAIVIDKESGSILYSKNPDTQLFPASITKLMTAVVALDTFQLDKVVTITKESQAVGSTMKLQANEKISVENLLKGLLISSGNDAAYALAEAYSGGYEKFVEAMNTKAQALHMERTTYKNVSGVEQDGHVTTVRDIATLAQDAMTYQFVREKAPLEKAVVTDTTNQITHELQSTDKLLGKVVGLEGIKTGWTTQAGECLVAQVTRNGHTIISVVLKSDDRFGETEYLIEWAFSNYTWKTFQFEEDPLFGDSL